MRHNQITVTRKRFENLFFLETLEALYNIHPYFKFNSFDEERYEKPTDDK